MARESGSQRAPEPARVHLFFGDQAAYETFELLAISLFDLAEDINSVVFGASMEGLPWEPRCGVLWKYDYYAREGPQIDTWGAASYRWALKGNDAPFGARLWVLFRGEVYEVDRLDNEAVERRLSFSKLDRDVFTATAGLIELFLGFFDNPPSLPWVSAPPPVPAESQQPATELPKPSRVAGTVTPSSGGTKTQTDQDIQDGADASENYPEDKDKRTKRPASSKHKVKLGNWAIGLGEGRWWLFQHFPNKRKFCQRGGVKISRGNMTTLAEGFRQHGTRISKHDMVKLFRKGKWQHRGDSAIFNGVCKPTCSRLASAIREAIAEVVRIEPSDIPDPIRWVDGAYCCDVAFGNAERDERSRMDFKPPVNNLTD